MSDDLVGKWVMHRQTGVAGKFKKLWPAGTYRKDSEVTPPTCEVMELEDGNAFVWKSGVVVVLTKEQVQFHVTALNTIRHTTLALAKELAALATSEQDGEVMVTLLANVYEQQARALK